MKIQDGKVDVIAELSVILYTGARREEHNDLSLRHSLQEAEKGNAYRNRSTNPCFNPRTVLCSEVWSTLIYNGPGLKDTRARSSTFVVWVAENSVV